VGSNPRPTARAAGTIGLRLRAASITVSSQMLFSANIMLALSHGTLGARSVKLRPQTELSRRISDAVTGV
jgi:hypothetical protein